MGQFIVNGNKKLSGEIQVSGSKNAALPLVFAAVLISGTTVFYGMPDISDVNVALDILTDLGAVVCRSGSCVSINTEKLSYSVPDVNKVSRLRASSYLIGAALGRFGIAEIQSFGGCNFDSRPIDMHLFAARLFGAKIEGSTITADRLLGSDVFFDKVSVGATINAILLAVSACGKSRIYGYAKEPHVESLIDFLVSAGARIIIKSDCLEIEGAPLRSTEARVIPDMIEAGTYAALALLTNSDFRISGVKLSHLDSFFEFLLNGGAVIAYDGDSFRLSGSFSERAELLTEPYPGFPTDLQPIAAPLLANGSGGIITEGVWNNRFGYLCELEKFGVIYERKNNSAFIKPSKLRSAIADAVDLRGGAALLVTALSTPGESVINVSENIKRGYDNIVNKFRRIGADIIERNT